MRIFDQNDKEITAPDTEKGRLENDRILIAHHEAITAVEEVGHYEVIAEYPNGGKDVEWVIDVEGVEAQDAWDEYEDILRFIPYTEAELRIRAAQAARLPMNEWDILQLLIPKQIATLDVDDNTALRMKSFFPEWTVGTQYDVGAKVCKDDKLWKVRQTHTAQIGWEPENVPALFEVINETHSGTTDDPIPYEGNMALTAGLYYYQDNRMFECTRDTINPVYHALVDLVGLYVKEWGDTDGG